MFSTAVAFPLSAGRMLRFVLSLRVLSAALSVFLKLSLGREENQEYALCVNRAL